MQNSVEYRAQFQIQHEAVTMPLLTLSLANTGVTDAAFQKFAHMLDQMKQTYELQGGLSQFPVDIVDYYRGGMAVNFSENPMSIASFAVLHKLLLFRGLRSINLSRLTEFVFVDPLKA